MRDHRRSVGPHLLHPDLVFWPLAGLRAACPPQRGQQGSLRDPL